MGYYAGYADALKVCCGYHENYDHVWCGNRANINNTEVYGASCKDPSKYVSWDGVHYTQAANQWAANHTHYGGLTDPPVPLVQACHRQWESAIIVILVIQGNWIQELVVQEIAELVHLWKDVKVQFVCKINFKVDKLYCMTLTVSVSWNKPENLIPFTCFPTQGIRKWLA